MTRPDPSRLFDRYSSQLRPVLPNNRSNKKQFHGGYAIRKPSPGETQPASIFNTAAAIPACNP